MKSIDNKIKIAFILASIVACTMCNEKKTKIQVIEESYDEKNFIEWSHIANRNGFITSTFYRNKNDTNFFMLKKFWNNDSLLSCMFFRKHIQRGPSQIFDSLDGLSYEGFYLNDKKNGFSLFYDKGKLYSIEVYENNKVLTFDSSEVKQISSAVNKK